MSEKEFLISENQIQVQLGPDQPATYRIRIKGDLAEYRPEQVEGMEISKQIQEDGSTITMIQGQLENQAALFNMLVGFYDKRLPLISVECLGTASEEDSSSINVRVEQEATHLEFIVTGTYDLSKAVEKFPLVIMACRQTGLSKALVDYRPLAGEILVTEELLYAYRAGGFYNQHLSSGGQPLKIAFVGKERLPYKGGEAVGKTYGAEILATSDYQEAVDWLCHDS